MVKYLSELLGKDVSALSTYEVLCELAAIWDTLGMR